MVRQNIIKPFVQSFIAIIASYPALLVEICTRHRFGVRYFPFVSCVSAIFVMLLLGVIWTGWQDALYIIFFQEMPPSRDDFSFSNILFVAFGVLAFVQSLKHYRNQQKEGRTVDFQRFSLSQGESRPYWYKLAEYLPESIYERLPVNETNLRRYYEPFTAILIGLIFLVLPFSRSFGLVIVFCGLMYYWRTSIQYAWGRDWLLNLIDNEILAAEMEAVFMEDKPPAETRGVMVQMPLPENMERRKALFDELNKGNSKGFQ